MSEVNCYWDSHALAQKLPDNIALIEADLTIEPAIERRVSYRDLDRQVASAKQHISSCHANASTKQLIMITAHNNINSVVYYLAALQLKHTIWWVDKDISGERLQALQSHYKINLHIDDGKIHLVNTQPIALHPELALLISTSGSTGSPTLVRLSYQNLNSNCQAIALALSLTSSDCVVTTLPLQYSFGLSILNSHLKVGSTLVLSDASLMSRDFWTLFKSYPIRCLYGVPYTFDMLLKLGLVRLPLKSLRLLAVAGGKLTADKVTLVNDYCLSNESQFYVMYGQTEATARITVLTPSKTKQKPFAIGHAIAGKVWLENEQKQRISEPNQIGELCYQGENVMMGLASNLADLNLPATTDLLRTGDLASFDNDGDFKIVGRLKRIIKVLGHRINLDEVEHYFSLQKIQLVCTGQDDMIVCYLLKGGLTAEHGRRLVCDYLSIHSTYCQCVEIAEFPYLPSGKLNYQQLQQLHSEQMHEKASTEEAQS